MTLSKTIYFFLLLAVIGALVFYVIRDSEHKKTYEEQLISEREEDNAFFQSSPKSPIVNKENFTGLIFFAPKPEFNVVAQIERIKPPQPISIVKSGGSRETYYRFAKATFELDGATHEVTLLKTPESRKNHLFLPFTDETSGKSTYGAGRYIDLEYTGNDKISIDFNYAYNPYCAYNDDYLCPIPPLENHIHTEILAGEKKYQKSKGH